MTVSISRNLQQILNRILGIQPEKNRIIKQQAHEWTRIYCVCEKPGHDHAPMLQNGSCKFCTAESERITLSQEPGYKAGNYLKQTTGKLKPIRLTSQTTRLSPIRQADLKRVIVNTDTIPISSLQPQY